MALMQTGRSDVPGQNIDFPSAERFYSSSDLSSLHWKEPMSFRVECSEIEAASPDPQTISFRTVLEKWTDGRDAEFRNVLEKFPAFPALVDRIDEGLPFDYLAGGNEIERAIIEDGLIEYGIKEELFRRAVDGSVVPGRFKLRICTDPKAPKDQRVFDAMWTYATSLAKMKAHDTSVVVLASKDLDVSSDEGAQLIGRLLSQLGFALEENRLVGERGRLTIRLVGEYRKNACNF
jgi:hypothetical protein